MTDIEWAVGAQLLDDLKAKRGEWHAYREAQVGSPDSGGRFLEANALWERWLIGNGETLLEAAMPHPTCKNCLGAYGEGPTLCCPECGTWA